MKLITCLFTLGIVIVLNFDICVCQTTAQTNLQQTKANQTKQARTNFNEQHYNNGQQVWNPNNRFELASIVPSVIIFAGLILLLIPLCLSLFTPFLFGANNTPYTNNPWYGYHGRKKREIVNEINKKAKSFGLVDRDLINFDDFLPSASTLLQTVTRLGESIEKFSK